MWGVRELLLVSLSLLTFKLCFLGGNLNSHSFQKVNLEFLWWVWGICMGVKSEPSSPNHEKNHHSHQKPFSSKTIFITNTLRDGKDKVKTNAFTERRLVGRMLHVNVFRKSKNGGVGFRVSAFRVWGLGVHDSRFGVWVQVFCVKCSGFRVQVLGFKF